MKRALILLVALLMAVPAGVALTGCQGMGQGTLIGAGAGAAGGGILGALIDRNNRWRGALIGGAAGAVVGGTLGYIIQRSNQQAAQTGQPRQYTSTDGRQRVVSTPVGRDPQTGCTIVREDVYYDGRLVRRQNRQVCQ